jgi:cytochrome c553
VSYIWNEAQTDAVLAPDAGEPGVAALTATRRHNVPSVGDCVTCHGARRTEPLGFNPLQLSTDRDPNAIHGEPLPEGAVTLRTLVDEGLLVSSSGAPRDAAPRINTTSPRTRSALGYLSTNCGSCHRGDGDAAAQVPSMRYGDVMRDGDAAAQTFVGRATRWQAPGAPEGATVLLNPDSPELSAILVRMRSRSPSSQMPPLGTVLRDQTAVDALTRWMTMDLRPR